VRGNRLEREGELRVVIVNLTRKKRIRQRPVSWKIGKSLSIPAVSSGSRKARKRLSWKGPTSVL